MCAREKGNSLVPQYWVTTNKGSISIGVIQKVPHLGKGQGGWRKRWQKMTKEVGDATKKVISLTQILSATIFWITQYLLLYISWSSDNITVTNNEGTSKR